MDQISEHARSSRKPVTPLSWNTSYQTHVSLSSKHLEENAKARVVTEWGSHAEAVETILARTDIALHRIAGFVNVRKDAYALVFIGSAHSSSWWMVFRPRFGHTLGQPFSNLEARVRTALRGSRIQTMCQTSTAVTYDCLRSQPSALFAV